MSSSQVSGQQVATESRVKVLTRKNQSVWLDYIRKSLIDSGDLSRLIEVDGVSGVTSNPAIFEKAIAGSLDYRDDLKRLGDNCATSPKRVYEQIAIRDIQRAADVLQPVYEASDARDGYVSLEVSPTLARDTAGTLDEARRLWVEVGRPNLMIKVPATDEGIPAIERLIAEGINVNVTLLFSVESYGRVAEAYLSGLEHLVDAGGKPSRVASVASFFISRIDSAVDRLLDEAGTTKSLRQEAADLKGRAAIANAKLAYMASLRILKSPRWAELVGKGARPQRLLWASTSAKDPRYRDVVYVEELIGSDTVNTVPPATLDAFRDHGEVRESLGEALDEAPRIIERLGALGIDFDRVTATLLEEGLATFDQAFTKLLDTVAAQTAPRGGCGSRLESRLPPALDAAVAETLQSWRSEGKARRMWERDATLWTGHDEADWLGWLGITESQLDNLPRFARIAREARDEGFSHVALLGMGGSSLCPEVLRMTFGRLANAPDLLVLDSTDPAQIRALERTLDLERTLFVVSSKSGTTIEPNIFKDYFFERLRQTVGAKQAGRRFIAITDPGSALQKVAERDAFREVFFGLPSVGGRFSALSDFGMVPAALIGIDVGALLHRADEMAHACSGCVPVEQNPGVVLGAILGTAALEGKDKMTIVTSPQLHSVGAWLEQLLAESTGKNGKGLIPVDREPLGSPQIYGDDRLFVSLELAGDETPQQQAALEALERAGHPVVRIPLRDRDDLAAEFLRWEIATAVAGEVLGIHPFNQPDVEASKIETRKLTAVVEEQGGLPREMPSFEIDGVQLYTDEANRRELEKAAGDDPSLADLLRAHFERLRPGDYAAFLAYVERNAAHEACLQEMRIAVRDRKRVATCVGFGPRFLHSTGQAYKGGPNTAVVVQITCDDAEELGIPGRSYGFGVVKAAQARGDFQVLLERERRALRVHLGADAARQLTVLRDAVRDALG